MSTSINRRSFVSSVIAAVAAVTLGPTGIRSARANGTDHTVEINGFVFTPDTLTVKSGDTVTWVNRDIVSHTATALDDSWDTGEILTDESQSIVVKQEMTLSYYCRYHTNMKAELKLSTD